MSRKKATKTISHLDGVKRTNEVTNEEELNRKKFVFVNGVKKSALNEDLFGRKLIVNLEDQNYEEEHEEEFDNGYENKYEEEYNNFYDNDENENELDFDENEYNNEFDNEYDNEYESNEYESNEFNDHYQYCQKCEKYKNKEYCQNCYNINRKISKYTKISFTIIILLLAVGLGYAISFFDGITY